MTLFTNSYFTFQANRKDLQRFLGLNDSEEMVYIRNVRKPFPRHRQQSKGDVNTLYSIAVLLAHPVLGSDGCNYHALFISTQPGAGRS